MPVWDAASISITSTWRPSAIARHGSHTPHGSIVGPPCPSGPTQFMARAMMRAVVVLPTPRTPVSMNACATRPSANALRKVRTIASCPIRSAKPVGRYLRASTRYGVAAAGKPGRVGSSPNKPDMRAAMHRRGGVPQKVAGGRPNGRPRWKLTAAASFRT